MTETSLPWDGTATGDATSAPYDAATKWAAYTMAVSGAGGMANKGGTIDNDLGSLLPSIPGLNTCRIAAGHAIVYGTWYENSANSDVNLPSPAAATRIDLVVLRKSWSSQTIRITRIAGVEGGGAPALIQVIGTTWDIPLAQCSITTLGVVTMTDIHEILINPSHASLAQAKKYAMVL